MRKTHSAGGVVLNAQRNILVVNQKGRSWSLPKGHVEQGETLERTARREIYEESGITKLVLIKKLGTYKRPKLDSENKDSKEEMKVITIFFFTTSETHLESHDPENPHAMWVTPDETEKLLTHPKDKAFFRKIKAKLSKK